MSCIGSEETLRQQYVLGDEIGCGRFGTVRRCYSAATGEALAVKSTLLAISHVRHGVAAGVSATGRAKISLVSLEFLLCVRSVRADSALLRTTKKEINMNINHHNKYYE
jgi:hypothetical protein